MFYRTLFHLCPCGCFEHPINNKFVLIHPISPKAFKIFFPNILKHHMLLKCTFIWRILCSFQNLVNLKSFLKETIFSINCVLTVNTMSFREIERKCAQFQKMKVNEPLNSCNSMRLMTCYVRGAVQGSIEYPFMALSSLQLMKIIRCKRKR